MNSETSKQEASRISEEEAAAIGLALHRYMNETVHDMESYIITIKRKRYYEVI